MTAVNIACAVPECKNAVIGQCPGFQQPCGRYYCSDHHDGTLCLDCQQKKKTYELYNEYLQIAEKIKKSETPTGFGCSRALVGFNMGLMMLVGVLFFGSICFFSAVSGDFNNGGLFVLVLILAAMFGGVFWLISWAYKSQVSRIKNRAMQKATDINKTKPGFLEFYKAWDNKTPEDELKDLLKMATGFAVAGAAGVVASAVSGANQSRQDEKIRNAVDDELRRRGIN